jgi:hypothetical protein
LGHRSNRRRSPGRAVGRERVGGRVGEALLVCGETENSGCTCALRIPSALPRRAFEYTCRRPRSLPLRDARTDEARAAGARRSRLRAARAHARWRGQGDQGGEGGAPNSPGGARSPSETFLRLDFRCRRGRREGTPSLERRGGGTRVAHASTTRSFRCHRAREADHASHHTVHRPALPSASFLDATTT